MRQRTWCLVLFAGAALPVLCADFEVDLTVTESAGVERKSEPISGGVPLPKGMFKQGQEFALFGDDGGEVPCQVSPLVVETDGTLRWILLDFQDDIAANAVNQYVLKAVRAKAKWNTRLKVDDGEEGVSIDTGTLRAVVSKKKPFALLEDVIVSGKPVVTEGRASCVQLTERKGWDDESKWQPTEYTAGVPEIVRVHQSGPARVTIEVAGHFRDDPLKSGYHAWITAWAGKSQIRLRYKISNSNPDQYCLFPVKRSILELRLAKPPADVVLGASSPIATSAGEGWLHQGLLLHHTYQDIEGAVKAGKGEEVLWTGNSPKDRPSGWIAAKGATTVFVSDVLFSSNPARRLAVQDGTLVLDGIAERFEGPTDKKFKKDRPVGQPWMSEGFWLYDCSHHSSEYVIDFAAPAEPAALDTLCRASRNRLWVLAPPGYYADCGVLSVGRFGSLEDEKECYRKWGMKFTEKQVPDHTAPRPGGFVGFEDNHYESEADSVQGLLLMYLRTGQRGWFDEAEAWARYHMDLEVWRTDGWKWKDGAIWFPSGGPQGNLRTREKWNFGWGPNWGNRQNSIDCADLWNHSRAKSCYCHYYGSGLCDYFCLTGERDALDAALDNLEEKDEEFRRYRKFEPGKSPIGCIRGFGRGFEVMMRVLEADPGNKWVEDLCHLCARTLRQTPVMDERGFVCAKIGGGVNEKDLSPNVRKWMEENGVTFTAKGGEVRSLSKGGKTWPVRSMGGTWMHVYVQNGADLYARRFDDEDMRDFTIAFAQFSAKFMLSDKCHQTWYYTHLDIPDLGMMFDPWAFDHTDTRDGVGCVHSGYYTRHYPDACAKGFSFTGEKHLLEKGREFWYYGSKRSYRTKNYTGAPDEVGFFAHHHPPKDDCTLSTARLFYETAHPRTDLEPPDAVSDLSVKLTGDGRGEVRFTAPKDNGGGRVARYQLKADTLPILPYEEWGFARDSGTKRNWWKAVNLKGEPAPSRPGTRERFVVSDLPNDPKLHFAIRSFDDSNNRSAISNCVSTE